MFVLSICQQLCPNKIPVQVGDRLGAGADGEVLSIVNQPDRVIKLSIVYQHSNNNIYKQLKHTQNVLRKLIVVQPEAYVRVYQYGYLGSFAQQKSLWCKDKQRFIMYYSIMERLFPISEDEQKVFHSIVSHEDRGIKKDFSVDKIYKMLQGMNRGLDFDVEKVMLFYNNINGSAISHLDVAPRNIMKNNAGEFKLIDLDRVSIKND